MFYFLFICSFLGTALPLLGQPLAGSHMVGALEMAGDPGFDADTVVNSENNHWQWLSYPGARLALNPSPNETRRPAPLGKDLPLNLGGWFGARTRILYNVNRIRVGAGSGTVEAAKSSITRWTPYRFGWTADYTGGIRIRGYDMFKDSDSSLIRYISVDGALPVTLELSGSLAGNQGGEWNAKAHVMVVRDDDYVYAIRFVRLDGKEAEDFSHAPTVSEGRYSVVIARPKGSFRCAIGFGIASRQEGEKAAIARARNCFNQSIDASAMQVKANIESYLKRVPKPTVWGIPDVNTRGVTGAKHRRAYYAAWTFLIEDTIHKLPESNYNYAQVMCGKPSLWNEGHPRAPGMAQWESLLGMQWLAYVMPGVAWSSFQGLMSLVDGDGRLGGESLPTRKAQTAWILYSLTHDRKQLGKVYPAVRRYLIWAERNPRWIYKSNNNPAEKDSEFVTSWLYDSSFAIQICEVLGMKADVEMWRMKQRAMVAEARKWFYSDPATIWQYYFDSGRPNGAEDGVHRGGNPSCIAQGIGVSALPADVRLRLLKFFSAKFKADLVGAGFPSYKYPNVNLIAYGLLDSGRKSQARQFVAAVLRDEVNAGAFGEVISAKSGAPVTTGVQEALFSPLNIIDFTWLLNRCRYDKGSPVPIN